MADDNKKLVLLNHLKKYDNMLKQLIEDDLDKKEDIENKVTEITMSATNDQYPTALAAYNYSNIEVVNMTDTTAAINPNKFYVWGEVAELNISLNEPTDSSIYNEYMFQFTSGDTATELSLPENIIWYLDNNTILPNMTYQISIVDNMAVLGEF